MDEENYPPFAEALNRFQRFLSRQGVSQDIIWVFREDIAEHLNQDYLRIPIEEQVSLVERLYAEGCRRQLGISFSVYCFLEDRPCCYLFIPQDVRDAEQSMMPNGLKFSIPVGDSRRVATPIRSRWLWIWYRLVQNPIFADDLLPKRSNYAKKLGKEPSG